MFKSDYYRHNKKSVLTANCHLNKTRKDARIKMLNSRQISFGRINTNKDEKITFQNIYAFFRG